MLDFLKKRVTLLGLLALSSATALYYQVQANRQYPTIVPTKSTYYTPGKNKNCKWVIHISNKITTYPGDTSPVQIGIPEVIEEGYISGIIQSGPGESILLAFNIPSQDKNTPPIVLIANYTKGQLPLKSVRFRVSNSSALTMMMYSSYEQCIEATM